MSSKEQSEENESCGKQLEAGESIKKPMQFCLSATTGVFTLVFSLIWRDGFFVSPGGKCLGPTKTFPHFLSLPNNTHFYFLSFIFHLPFFTSNQTYPKSLPTKFVKFWLYISHLSLSLSLSLSAEISHCWSFSDLHVSLSLFIFIFIFFKIVKIKLFLVVLLCLVL